MGAMGKTVRPEAKKATDAKSGAGEIHAVAGRTKPQADVQWQGLALPTPGKHRRDQR